MIFLMVKNVLLLLQEKSNESITNTYKNHAILDFPMCFLPPAKGDITDDICQNQIRDELPATKINGLFVDQTKAETLEK